MRERRIFFDTYILAILNRVNRCTCVNVGEYRTSRRNLITRIPAYSVLRRTNARERVSNGACVCVCSNEAFSESIFIRVVHKSSIENESIKA